MRSGENHLPLSYNLILELCNPLEKFLSVLAFFEKSSRRFQQSPPKKTDRVNDLLEFFLVWFELI